MDVVDFCNLHLSKVMFSFVHRVWIFMLLSEFRRTKADNRFHHLRTWLASVFCSYALADLALRTGFFKTLKCSLAFPSLMALLILEGLSFSQLQYLFVKRLCHHTPLPLVQFPVLCYLKTFKSLFYLFSHLFLLALSHLFLSCGCTSMWADPLRCTWRSDL